MFKEDEHPRDNDGKFTNKNGGGKSGYDSRDEFGTMKKAVDKKSTLTKNIVKVDTSAAIQKKLDEAETAKERQKIAYQYIMDNLRGKYTASDGRTVAIEKVGADKITHRDIKIKLRVCPSLADMIKAGEFEGIKDAEEKSNPKFVKFAYYKVTFQLGNDRYTGLLNVGIRKDGSSTLYDLNPFDKQ